MKNEIKNLILTKEYNGDHCDVVAIPNPFIVEVTYNRDSGFIEVGFSCEDDYSEEPPRYTVSLYVGFGNQDSVCHLMTHNGLNNFTTDLMRYIVNDIIKYLKTGFYYDDEEYDSMYEEPYDAFNLNHYIPRWEEYISELLNSEENSGTDSEEAENSGETIR